MKIAIFGDVVGRKARSKICEVACALKTAKIIDFIIVNGENSAGGFGITKKIFDEFISAGVDIVTTGNHVWDQKETLAYIKDEPYLLRPLNYPKHLNGMGYCIKQTRNKKKVMVINLMGQLFMPSIDDPFSMIDELLDKYELKHSHSLDAIIIDFHAEATSEKMAMGHFVDGRVSALVGTHTHVPTADDAIFPMGTSYITDLGMCGDYNSVLGLNKEEAISRFTSKLNSKRLSPATGDITLSGVAIEINDVTGLTDKIEPFRVGEQLRSHYPSFLKPFEL